MDRVRLIQPFFIDIQIRRLCSKTQLWLFLVMGALVCLSGCEKPQPTDIVGSFDTPGFAYAVAVAGSNAFVADGYEGLHIFDIRDPTKPALMATAGFIHVESVFVAPPYAYVAGQVNEGLGIVDVRSPANPIITAKISTQGFTKDVFVSGSTAFVTNQFNNGGLDIIDVGNRKRPFLMESVDIPYGRGIFVSDGSAYMACGFEGIKIVDVRDRRNPALVKSIAVPGIATQLWVAGRYVFVSGRYEGIQVIDLKHPAGAKIVNAIDTGESANDIVVRQGKAFVANGKKGLLVIDVSDPKNSKILKSVDTPGSAHALDVSGDHVYVADGFSGLQIISLKTNK